MLRKSEIYLAISVEGKKIVKLSFDSLRKVIKCLLFSILLYKIKMSACLFSSRSSCFISQF